MLLGKVSRASCHQLFYQLAQQKLQSTIGHDGIAVILIPFPRPERLHFWNCIYESLAEKQMSRNVDRRMTIVTLLKKGGKIEGTLSMTFE